MNRDGQPSALGELLFLSGSQKGQTFQITKARIGIGRQPDDTNDLIVPEGSVSRHHAEIILDNGLWRINKLSENNSLFIDKQAVQQIGVISNRSVIGLGPDVEILFLSYIPEEEFDAGSAPTIYQPPKPEPGGNQGQPAHLASDDPFRNPGHPAWQMVGIITGLSGIFIALETAIPIAEYITAVVTLFLCTSIVWRARRQAVTSQSTVRKVRLSWGRALTNSLLINVMLVIVSAIAIDLALASGQEELVGVLGLLYLVFLLGILVSFISSIIQIFHLLQKRLLPGRRVLWISVASCGITAVAIIVLSLTLASKNADTRTLFGLVIFHVLILFFESFLTLVMVGIYMLVKRFSQPSLPQKVSMP